MFGARREQNVQPVERTEAFVGDHDIG